MRIYNIYISGYKIFNPLQNLTLGKSPQLLIGINGSGKSSLLEAIAIIFSTVKDYCLNPKVNEKEFDFKIEYSFNRNELIEETSTTSSTHLSIDYVILSSSKENGLLFSMYVNEEAVTSTSEMFKYLPDNLIFYYAGYCETLERIVGKAQEKQADGLWRKRSNDSIETIVKSITKNITYIHKEYYAILFLLNYIDRVQKLPLSNKKFSINNILFYIQKPRTFTNTNYKELYGLSGFLRTFIDNLISQSYTLEVDVDTKQPFFRVDYHRSILEAVENLPNLTDEQRYNHTRFFVFHFISLLYSIGIIDKIIVSINDEEQDKIYSIEDLSEGEQQLVIIEAIQNVLCKDNSVLFLDEPDAYLHPQRQRELMPHISNIFTESYTQIIATSHSPFVAQSVDIENILLFKNGSISKKNDTTILDTTAITNVLFGITERFNENIEEKIEQFRNYRDAIMQSKQINIHAFKQLVTEIQNFGEETSVIIARELTQLKRLKGFDING